MTGNRATLLFLALIAVVSAGALVVVSEAADDADAATSNNVTITVNYVDESGNFSNIPTAQTYSVGVGVETTLYASDLEPTYKYDAEKPGEYERSIFSAWWCWIGSGFKSISPGDVIYSGAFSSNETYNLSLFALSGKNVVIHYDANGGLNAPDTTAGLSVAHSISKTVPTREGYTFEGWALSPGGSVAYAASTDDAVVWYNTENGGYEPTLYAVWGFNSKLTLIFDANGGAGSPEAVTSTVHFIGNNATVTLPTATPTRGNYTFAGWSLSADGAASYQPGHTISVPATANGTVTLYAVWNAITIDGYGVRVSYDTIEMVPSGNTDATYWSNGYQNTSVSMLVQRPAQSTTMPVTAVYTDGTKSSAYNVSYDGAWSVNGVAVGDWPGIVLTMSVSGVSARPVSSMVSMADYTVVGSDTVVSADGQPRIRYIEISGLDGGRAMNVQIVDTVIYADASSAYVADGVFSPATKYPDADNIMLVYNTPVHPGDAISIRLSSGQSYRWEVSGSGVTIDGAVYPIQGVTLVWAAASLGTVTIAGQTYDAGHLYYRTAPAAPLIDLGETTNAFAVTNEGVWIASVDYYAGVSKTSTAVHWGGSYWSLDWNTALALLAGFTLIAFLAIRVGTNRTVTWIDFAVLGVGAIIILILMEP